ncbi:MAG: hypothetical protein PVJ39_14975 [Gammaproteobacteria bacterium]|jgi:hypothetical protein
MPPPMGNFRPTPGWSNDLSPEEVGILFGVTGIGLTTYAVLKFRNRNTDNFEVASVLQNPLLAITTGIGFIILGIAAQLRPSPIYECAISFVTTPDLLIELALGLLFVPFCLFQVLSAMKAMVDKKRLSGVHVATIVGFLFLPGFMITMLYYFGYEDYTKPLMHAWNCI